jgi:CheY-like chemotaxis protein
MAATLLVCGSESPSRDKLERFFSQCGFRVRTAHDGLDCLEKVRLLQPEVLVADVDTPWDVADEVMTFLHQDGFGSETPFVFVVGDATPRILARLTGVPEASCFQKPLQMERLLDRVGLAFAQVDLRRKEDGPAPGQNVAHFEDVESCLV